MAGIADFANLGNSLESLASFKRKWPDFFPKEVYDFCLKQMQEGPYLGNPPIEVDVENEGVSPSSQTHVAGNVMPPKVEDVSAGNTHKNAVRPTAHNDAPHFLAVYRDWLRELWRKKGNDDPEDLWIMLGLQEDSRSEYALMGCYLPLAYGGLSWRTGQFEYQPECEFQAALYAIIQKSWRAKVCSLCSSFFVADKPAQLYCGTECTGEARRRRGQKWWGKHGISWRKERKRATQKRSVQERQRS